MQIIILHGDDERKLFERLQKFIETARKRSWEVVYLDEAGQNLREILSGTSLFGAERFFVLRNMTLLGGRDIEWLSKKYTALSGNLIIYHEGLVNQTILKALPKDIKIEEYKLPVLIWNFLDGLLPKNGEKSVILFHRIIEKEAPEFIFTQVSRHFRDLYWVKIDSQSIPYQPWRISKLKSQSFRFLEEKLKDVISRLSEIDIEVKTGKADLVSSLDLLMLKQLE